MNKNSFYIKLQYSPYKKGDIIFNAYEELLVLKYIKRTWWRKLFSFFGAKYKFDHYKVVKI